MYELSESVKNTCPSESLSFVSDWDEWSNCRQFPAGQPADCVMIEAKSMQRRCFGLVKCRS